MAGVLFYPGRTNLGVDVYAEFVDGELVACADQEAARQRAEYLRLGQEITGAEKDRLIAEILARSKQAR